MLHFGQQMAKSTQCLLIVTLVAIASLALIDGAQSERKNQRAHQPQTPPQQSQQAPQLPTAKSGAEAADEARARQERAEFDRKFAKLTDQFAQYAVILTVLAGLQFLALVVQMIVLAMTARTTRITAVGASEAADTIKKTLSDLERPYVLPTDVGKIYFSNDHPQVRHFVHFKVANHGKKPAILQRVQGKFLVAELPLTNEKMDGPNTPDGTEEIQDWCKTISLGSDRRLAIGPFFLPKHVEIEKYEGFGRPASASDHQLFLRLTISFWDMARLKRTYCSLWKYDRARLGFVSWGEEQFTHETEGEDEPMPPDRQTHEPQRTATIRAAFAEGIRSAQLLSQGIRSMIDRGIRAAQPIPQRMHATLERGMRSALSAVRRLPRREPGRGSRA
jgi:hypothetical protein